MSMMSPAASGQRSDRPNPTPKRKTITDFGGVNLRAARQAIGDEEFAWLENVQPIGPGNLRVTPPPSTTLQTIASQNPVSVWPMNLAAVDYDFVVMAGGHIYQVKKTTPYTATQITSVSGAIFGSGLTALAQWNNSTVLIIDPTAGYWYWNGSSLTAISNTLATVTITDPGVYGGTPPTASVSGGGGSGATVSVAMGIITAKINAAGTNYTVGDPLTVNTGGFISGGDFPIVKVTTVSAGGVITGLSVENAGTVTGGVGTTGLTTTGGTGSAATVDVTYGVTQVTITNPGSGYTGTPSITFSGGTITRAASATATSSGALTGTSIATYAGRAWIGSGRTVSFTDVDAFTSFGGAGGAFTIDDETLHGNITALTPANGFLYIAGDDSWDILGDVQVNAGVTTFTRQNVTASVGTNIANSIFPFYRSLYFANRSGFYSLSGSTPQKLSDNLDGLFQYIDFTKPVTSGQVMVRNILCPAFSFYFNDNITPLAVSRPLIALLCQNKWFFVSTSANLKLVSCSPVGGIATLFGWNYDGVNATMVQVFGGSNTTQTVIAQTRLWDGEAPLFDKQILRGAMGISWNNQPTSGINITLCTDNEFRSAVDVISRLTTSPAGNTYSLTVASSPTGGGKYFGFSFVSVMYENILDLFAIEWQEGKIF